LVGEDALDLDAMRLIEGEGLLERGQDTGRFFIGKETGKGEAGMIIDGDVERLEAGARIAMGAITGGADTGLVKTAKLFNIKMKELAWGSAFVTDDRRLGRVERGEAVEAVPLEDPGQGSF